jgi:hypothetical protein
MGTALAGEPCSGERRGSPLPRASDRPGRGGVTVQYRRVTPIYRSALAVSPLTAWRKRSPCERGAGALTSHHVCRRACSGSAVSSPSLLGVAHLSVRLPRPAPGQTWTGPSDDRMLDEPSAAAFPGSCPERGRVYLPRRRARLRQPGHVTCTSRLKPPVYPTNRAVSRPFEEADARTRTAAPGRLKPFAAPRSSPWGRSPPPGAPVPRPGLRTRLPAAE